MLQQNMKLGKKNAWTFSKKSMIREGIVLIVTKAFKLILKECRIRQLIDCKIFLEQCMHFVEIKEG